MEIIICMGSSCFARGNNENVKIAKKFTADCRISTDLKLTGCLCMDDCSSGPVVSINGVRHYRVDPLAFNDLLNKEIKEK